VRGVVLAAGEGRRLRPLTNDLPKTLLEVKADRTILDIVLGNLCDVGIHDIAIVAGHAHERIMERKPQLERRHGAELDVVMNDHPDWNNAYSLWLARDRFADGAMICNGDTVHPSSVERSLLSAEQTGVLIAVDERKSLGDEEMKILLDSDRTVRRIHKSLNPDTAFGEYIGVSLVAPDAADGLTAALEATWRRDRSLYYEDGYQEFIDRGNPVYPVAVGGTAWTEVDDHDDLQRAKDIACRY
jgi:choline kinase